MVGNKSLGKRKRASSSQRRLQHQVSARVAARSRRLDLRDSDEEEDEEWVEEDDDDNDDGNEEEVVDAPPAPPKRIDSKKLPVLLSLFCGPRSVTGETMFTLEQLSSLAEVRSRLGRHFFWEMKRAGVPADLNFLRVNCTTPDHDGPIQGAWPLATAEAYEDWVCRLMEGEWHSGQFARVQVVGLTNPPTAARRRHIPRLVSDGSQSCSVFVRAAGVRDGRGEVDVGPRRSCGACRRSGVVRGETRGSIASFKSTRSSVFGAACRCLSAGNVGGFVVKGRHVAACQALSPHAAVGGLACQCLSEGESEGVDRMTPAKGNGIIPERIAALLVSLL